MYLRLYSCMQCPAVQRSQSAESGVLSCWEMTTVHCYVLLPLESGRLSSSPGLTSCCKGFVVCVMTHQCVVTQTTCWWLQFQPMQAIPWYSQRLHQRGRLYRNEACIGWLCRREPEERWHIQQVMEGSMFRTGDELIEQLQVCPPNTLPLPLSSACSHHRL